MIFANSVVTLNGTDFKVTQAQVNQASAEVEVSKMGDGATNTKLGVQTGDSIVLSFNQNFNDANVHQLVAAAYANCKSGGTAAVTVKPTGDAASNTNPRFELTGVIAAYNPFSASWNDKSPVSITIKTAGQPITANVG